MKAFPFALLIHPFLKPVTVLSLDVAWCCGDKGFAKGRRLLPRTVLGEGSQNDLVFLVGEFSEVAFPFFCLALAERNTFHIWNKYPLDYYA